MVKSLTMANKEEKTKNSLTMPKKGFVEKKKKQKFKEVPTGKVALINGSKAQNNKKNVQKQKGSPQKSPKANKSPQSAEKNSKKELKKKNAKPEEEEEDDTDSDEEINEGIQLDSSMLEESDDDASDDDEEESGDEEETKIPNILGASLADDTDEDDDEFEGQEEPSEKKGVKMFKGVNKSANSSKDSSAMEDSDEDDDDDDDEDDDEESGEEADESSLGLKALMSNSIPEDDEDDEDFVEAEGDDDDDDITSEEEDEEEDEKETKNSPTNPKKNKNSKTNKGKEDGGQQDVSLEELKDDKRTIFVGNLPTTVTKKQLTKLFKKFGPIDTMRLRGMVPKELGLSKKVAAITKNLHPKIKSVYAYIRFVKVESVKPALSMNDTEFEGNRLRVDSADKSIKYDPKKSVFLGNLHFNIDENGVRKHFEQCGEIDSIRVIRDPATRVGKGFGYVNFKDADSVALALELDGTMLQNRAIRVKPNLGEKAQKKKRSLSVSSGSESPKKKTKPGEESGKLRNKKNAMKRVAAKEQKQGNETSPQQNKAFQGQKADANKKKKNKVDKKKKVVAEKLAAKTKKRSH